jgi:hypothetical protein
MPRVHKWLLPYGAKIRVLLDGSLPDAHGVDVDQDAHESNLETPCGRPIRGKARIRVPWFALT